ncbi:hypothetical protein CC86DRAFT_366416 [Ophiobolus disseminans]|uniref:Uncharacterized protein n=1 Tax=Ophiobolus disseminans TaxID=1469910 RepID=A0A6A7AHC0_9PLEO|nr:hypothetical protein CC86DRAFT_366416 [Ophiobolus disseminans]
MRNTIYEYCMAVEEQKVLTVVHYPEGIPRRSVRGISTTTNFAHSFWGFTQTCKQVRDELTPWLLSKRSVRTPLETLNNYVELFHRPSPVDGKRIGRIEPICTGAPLPDHGVEILKLVKQLHHSPDFHLKLDPPSPYPPIEELQADPDSDLWDEMTIFRNVEHLFASGAQSAIDAAGIQAIHVTSIPRQRNDDEDEDDDEGDSQDTLIKLRIARGGDRDQQLKSIMKFLVLSGLARRTGLKVKARVARGNARWIAKAVNGMVVGWKTRRGRGVEVVRLVTEDGGGVDGFVGIELG